MVYNSRFLITMNSEQEQPVAHVGTASQAEGDSLPANGPPNPPSAAAPGTTTPEPEAGLQMESPPGEVTPEPEVDPWVARQQSSEAESGFSVHDRRRFANLLEEQSQPEVTSEPAPDVWIALEPEQEPEEEPWVELQQELRRVGRELSKNTRQAEANLEIFSETLEEIQRLPTVYAETVWQMKAGLLKEILSVLDGLEASLRAGREMLTRLEASAPPAHSPWWKVLSSPRQPADLVATLRQWLEGQQILHRRLLSLLHSQGVQEIESVGQRFDARLHRAAAIETRSDLPPGTILSEEVKGYLLDGRILRYAEVVVSSYEQNHRD